MEEAGQHLQGGGFAGAIGAEETDDLAPPDFESDRVDGEPGFVAAADHASERAKKAWLLTVEAVGFGEVACRNHDIRSGCRVRGGAATCLYRHVHNCSLCRMVVRINPRCDTCAIRRGTRKLPSDWRQASANGLGTRF